MPDPVSSFAKWATFYEIVGSSAGALTGLQFIVMTLISNRQSAKGMQEIRAFGTPTLVHFCSALGLSALMSVPWGTEWNAGIAISVFGTVGLLYAIRVISHARKAEYKPDAGDWFWYVALPLITHSAMLVFGVLLLTQRVFDISPAAYFSLLFLTMGIHNSWDTVTYVAVQQGTPTNSTSQSEVSSQ